VEWLQGDAMRRADVVAAARGVALIVHAVNPPGYRNWDTLVLPMIANTIDAARASGARILLPGTIYNYGAGTAQRLGEDTAQLPSSRKGALRVQMEERLREAAALGVRALVVRAGDFFGPRPGNNWFSQGLVKPGQPLRAITYPGAPGVGHAWAYLPDLADTMVRLVEQEDRLGVFETFHFAGHFDGDGMRMVEAIRRAAGKPALPVRRLPWWALRLLSPFVPLFREMAEMRYLWRQPFELDNAKLLRFLGSETHTPLDSAVGAALS
jgi:nucleoside-diphosphate-sugar epimerase